MNQPIRFGVYRFEPQTGRLWKGGDEIRITPRAAAVLAVLTRHAGEPVTKQQIGVSLRRFGSSCGFRNRSPERETVATTMRGGAVSERERHGLRRPETATESYECYLRGRRSLHRMQRADLENSRLMFERAISLDRRYAPAWAGVATVHALLFEWWGAHEEDLQEADRASRTAMELAPDYDCLRDDPRFQQLVAKLK